MFFLRAWYNIFTSNPFSTHIYEILRHISKINSIFKKSLARSHTTVFLVNDSMLHLPNIFNKQLISSKCIVSLKVSLIVTNSANGNCSCQYAHHHHVTHFHDHFAETHDKVCDLQISYSIHNLIFSACETTELRNYFPQMNCIFMRSCFYKKKNSEIEGIQFLYHLFISAYLC